MRGVISMVLLTALALPGYAQENKPTPAQMEQQKRMMDCNARASAVKGDERKKFMTDCLKGAAPSAAEKMQQEKVKDCSRRAASNGLGGDERSKFMSNCLRG